MATYDSKTGKNLSTGTYSRDSIALGVAPKGATVDSSTKQTVKTSSSGGGSSIPTAGQTFVDTQGNTQVATYDGATGLPFSQKAIQAGITASSGTARADESKLGKGITTASDPSYLSPSVDLSYLDDYQARLERRRQNDEASINATTESLKSSTSEDQRRETGQTSAMLARAGGYLGVSGSGTGVLLNLAQSHRNEMQAIEAKRLEALANARNAYEDKDFELAKLRHNEAKDAEQEAYSRRQTFLKQTAEAEAVQAKQEAQVDIYNAIASGITDPLEIFQKLGGKVAVDDINAFLKSVTPKDGAGDYAYTPSQTAKLIGSGLSAKDIKAAQDYINENGYTEAFRSQLSPGQKVAFDAIYREKAVSSSVSGADGIKVSFIPSKISTVVSQYGISQVFEDLISPTVPKWFYPVIKDMAGNHYAELGLGGPMSLLPDSDIGRRIWNEFKSSPDIAMFLQQVTKKITGSAASTNYGAIGGSTSVPDSLPAPIEG